MSKVIEYLTMMDDDYAEAQGDLLICQEGHCTEKCRTQNELEVAVYEKIMASHEYQALKASITKGKPCSLCYGNEFDFEGMICPECEKSNDVEPKKQTLLEFMDKRSGYAGESLTKDCFHRREFYKNVSEYLEQN